MYGNKLILFKVYMRVLSIFDNIKKHRIDINIEKYRNFLSYIIKQYIKRLRIDTGSFKILILNVFINNRYIYKLVLFYIISL